MGKRRFCALVGIVATLIMSGGTASGAQPSSGGVLVRIEHPTRERMSVDEKLEFDVQVNNPGAVDYPEVELRLDCVEMNKYDSSKGSSIEIATDGGPWRTLSLVPGNVTWSTTLDEGALPHDATRAYRVRYGSTVRTGKIQLNVVVRDATSPAMNHLSALEAVTVEVFRSAAPSPVPPSTSGSSTVGTVIGIVVGTSLLLLLAFTVATAYRCRNTR